MLIRSKVVEMEASYPYTIFIFYRKAQPCFLNVSSTVSVELAIKR